MIGVNTDMERRAQDAGGRNKHGATSARPRIAQKFDDKLELSAKPREEEILRAAASLFRSKGYHATSMSDLAAFVGMQKASLYYHFFSKDELLYRILQAGVSRVLALLNDILNTEKRPREQLQLYVRQNVLLSTQWADGFWVVMNEGNALPPEEREQYMNARRKVDRLLTELIERGIETNDFRPVDAKVAALSISSMMTGMLRWYKSTGRLKRSQIAEQLVDLVDAMLTPPGQPRQRRK